MITQFYGALCQLYNHMLIAQINIMVGILALFSIWPQNLFSSFDNYVVLLLGSQLYNSPNGTYCRYDYKN